MRKIFIILGTLILLLLVAVVLTPVLFKGKLIELVKTEANNGLNASLDFTDADLSLIRDFPKLSLGLEELSIVNQAPFDGDTLLSMRSFQFAVNLFSAMGDGPIEINALVLDQPKISLKTLEDGRTNWDILQEEEAAASSDTTASPAVNLAMQRYEMLDGEIVVDNRSNGQLISLEGINVNSSGDFTAARSLVSTTVDIANAFIRNENVPLLNNARVQAKLDLDVDQETGRFTFRENELRVNDLAVNFDGSVQEAGDGYQMDLTFDTPTAAFKSVLSMIPYIYKKDFSELQAAGSMSLQGKINGLLEGERVPAFDLALNVKDGEFQYPDLPTPVKNVQIALTANNPGTNTDATVIDLKNLHLEILNEPLDMQTLVKTPVSDAYLDASVKGKLNLDEIRNIVPMEEGVALNGRVQSDIRLRGNMSAIEENRADGYSVAGKLGISGVAYNSPDLPEKIMVENADLDFSPERASLKNFRAKVGDSDLQANGVLENIFGYIFHGQTVTGTLALNSRAFNLNPWMAGESEPLAPVELPDKIEFLLAAEFGALTFDNLNLKNVKSQLLLKDRQLNLMDLSANLFQGTFSSNGTYSYLPPAKPKIYFDMKLVQVNIPDMFQNVVSVQNFAPMAQHMQGSMGGNLTLNTDLDGAMMPEWQQFFSEGSLTIPKVKVKDFLPFNKIAEVLKIDKLHNPALSNLAPKYTIKNGRFHLKPMTFQVDQYKIVASGSNGFDKSLDYKLKVHVPAAELKNQGNALISQLVKKDVNLLTNETVVVDVAVGGSFQDPSVKGSSASVLESASDPLKQAAQDEADKRKAELEKQAQAELEKQKADLEKKKKEAEDALKDKLKGLFKKKKK